MTWREVFWFLVTHPGRLFVSGIILLVAAGVATTLSTNKSERALASVIFVLACLTMLTSFMSMVWL